MPKQASRRSRASRASVRLNGRLSNPLPYIERPEIAPGEAEEDAPGEFDDDDVYEESRTRMFDVHRIPIESAKRAVRSVGIPGGLKNEKAAVQEKAVPPPDHPPHLFPLHTLVGFIGTCGRGKTNAVYLLSNAYIEAGSFNRVFLITPTYESNLLWKSLKKLDKRDVYEDVAGAQAAISDIVRKIEEDGKIFKVHRLYKEAYEKWEKIEEKRRRGQEVKPENDLQPEERALIMSMSNEEGIPVTPTPVEQPSPLIIIDDMSSSPLFRTGASNPFLNLVLRHRHIAEVGCSIFVCVQNYRNGIPKVLRENFRVFCIFDTKDARALEAIYEEVGSISDAQSFLLKYVTAIDGNEHNFLTVDRFPDAPDPETKKLRHFRRNFDEFLVDPRTRDEVFNKLGAAQIAAAEFHRPRRSRAPLAAQYIQRAQDPYSEFHVKF